MRAMDPSRWNRIEELLQAALDLEPEARTAYLTSACGSDAALRAEVEELLAGESGGELLSQSPAIAMLGRSSEHLVGQTVSHYRLSAKIGAGGMGDVYEAHDENLKRTVALKVLPEEFTSDVGRVRRFEQEAFAASRLNHPNIITIFEILQTDGHHFIATERIEGKTLRELLKSSQKLDLDQALEIAVQVAGALKAAHTAWIIHRDIKPENIMVRGDGLVKVVDFGIAKLNEGVSDSVALAAGRPSSVVNREPPASGQRDKIDTPESLTAAGAILGTANYMSPEQARGEPLDGRTDLYSLGLVLQEMLTGERVPVHGKAPKEIQPILRKLLRSDRDERYSSAGELLDDLHRVKRRRESRSARRMVGVGVLAVIVAIAVAAIAAFLSVSEVWEERILRDGHTAASRQAVFSPDGRMVVSCGEDGQVIVWDFARRERIASLGHPSQKVAWSPDGRWVATGGIDGSIVIWDASRWTMLEVLRGHHVGIGALAFSPDATRLASAAAEVILWDTGRWTKLREWPDGTTHGTFIFTPDNRHFFYTSGVKVRDLDDGRAWIADEERGANWIAVSSDITQLASISPHGLVSFFRVGAEPGGKRLELITRFQAHQDHGRGIAFSPDGQLVASASEAILLWDAATHRKVARFEYASIVWSVVFSPDGRWLLSTHGDGAVLLWDVAERACVASLNEHSGAVRAVVFSPDGRRVVSGSEDRTVTLWDLASGRKEAVLAAHETRVTGVAYSRDGTQLASADQNGVIVFWDVANRRTLRKLQPAIPGPSYCVQFSEDGRLLLTTVGVRTTDGRMVTNLAGRPDFGQIYGADVSQDGRWLATVTDAGRVTIWDGRHFRQVEERHTPNTHQISVSLSHDGKWMVTGEDEGAVRLWSVRPLREIAILGRHSARVKSVAFAPDGKTVASAGDDKMIALWDVERRKLKARIGTHASPIYALAFSPDGTRLVSGEHDRSVRVYTRRRSVWGFSLE